MTIKCRPNGVAVRSALVASVSVLVWATLALGPLGAATRFLSRASELAHAVHRRLSHIAISLHDQRLTQPMDGNGESSGGHAYRVGAGIAGAGALVLLWMNAAVGIIGDGPMNLMYLGVLIVGFVGALIARLQPREMVLALIATAAAQMLVPTIALVLWKVGWPDLLIDPDSPNPPFHPGIARVFGLNAVFAMLWLVSAWEFRKAARGRR